MSDLIIVGAGKIARTINNYICDSYKVLGFMVDEDFIDEQEIDGLKVFSAEKYANKFISSDCRFLIAIGYSEMNEVRQRIFQNFKAKSAKFINFIHPSCSIARGVEIGYNNVFLENTVVQPFSNIGNNNYFWSNTVLSHGACVNDGNWIASGSIISGNCNVGSGNFFGVSSSLAHNVSVGNKNFVGANCLQTHNMKDSQVYVKNSYLPYDSKTFLRISGV